MISPDRNPLRAAGESGSTETRKSGGCSVRKLFSEALRKRSLPDPAGMIVVQALHHPLHDRCCESLLEAGILRQSSTHLLVHRAERVPIALPVAGERREHRRGLISASPEQFLDESAQCAVE